RIRPQTAFRLELRGKNVLELGSIKEYVCPVPASSRTLSADAASPQVCQTPAIGRPAVDGGPLLVKDPVYLHSLAASPAHRGHGPPRTAASCRTGSPRRRRQPGEGVNPSGRVCGQPRCRPWRLGLNLGASRPVLGTEFALSYPSQSLLRLSV